MASLLKKYAYYFVLAFLLVAETSANPLTVLLDWKPNIHHIGFYVAQKFYEQKGIKVRLLHPPQTAATLLVAQSKADFALATLDDYLHARDAGLPLKAVAAVLQKDTSCFAWRADLTTLTNPKSFAGHRYGGWGSPEEKAVLRYLMGAAFSKLTMVNIGQEDFLLAVPRHADIIWEYEEWNILRAQREGLKVGVYCPARHHAVFDRPNLLLVAHARKASSFAAFLEATSQGYQESVRHPHVSAQLFASQLSLFDPHFIEASLVKLGPSLLDAKGQWGTLSSARMIRYAQWMKEQGLIRRIPSDL